MGRALYDIPACRAIFDKADEALGFSLSKICFEGSKEELKQTVITQPAILTASVASWQLLEGEGFVPDYSLAHSLGEYSALVASGSLRFEDAVTLVSKRGKFMQEAVPAGEGAMYAIIGLPYEKVVAACAELRKQGGVVSPANDNAPGQVVIAGERIATEKAASLAKEMGAKRALPLQVSAPFHSELMKPAQERLEPFLNDTNFAEFRSPLISNVDASIVTEPGEARSALIKQVSSPVRWRDSMELLKRESVGAVIEIGPGTVLSGLAKRISKEWSILNYEDPEGCRRVHAELKKGFGK
jgi:[acyl-carrier-protein] S-malonyltransferase